MALVEFISSIAKTATSMHTFANDQLQKQRTTVFHPRYSRMNIDDPLMIHSIQKRFDKYYFLTELHPKLQRMQQEELFFIPVFDCKKWAGDPL